MDVTQPETVLPRIDTDEDHARNPREEHQAVGDVQCQESLLGFPRAYPEAKDYWDEGECHAHPVDNDEGR